jgi:hypothetical protein
MERGFFASLFDLSFTSFVTTRIIKVLYVLALIGIGLTMLVFIIGGFHESAAVGLLVLLIGAGLLYVIYTRVFLEFIIQVFRITELLRDQTELQRAAFAGGTVPVAPAPAAPAPPAPSATTPATCPHCGQPTTPGAHFCRSCGRPLS